MTLRNSPDSYGSVAKALHWAAAVLIFGLLIAGFGMVVMPFSPAKLEVYSLHKSFGLLVLVLVAARVLWRLGNPGVRALETHRPWEKLLAKAAHVLLYLLMLFMPLSGWLMSSAGDFPATFFGLFDLPPLVSKNEDLFEVLRDTHTVLAFVILGVVALHMAGAFKHHILDRDGTLRRMTSARLGLAGGLALAALAGAVWAAPLAVFLYADSQKPGQPAGSAAEDRAEAARDRAGHEDVTEWDVDEKASRIAFTVQQSGGDFQGAFTDFEADIYFDPANLAASSAAVGIRIDSIATGSAERDGQARGPEWFDAGTFPEALFVTESFVLTGPNRYEVRANLTLRGVTLPVVLPFSLEIRGDDKGRRRAVMDAELTLNRLDFGIGQGVWQGTETIGNPVIITLHVEADAGDSRAD